MCVCVYVRARILGFSDRRSGRAGERAGGGRVASRPAVDCGLWSSESLRARRQKKVGRAELSGAGSRGRRRATRAADHVHFIVVRAFVQAES